MITIYSDDPRGVKAAMAEEISKGNKVRLRDAKYRPLEDSKGQEETGPDIHEMTKAELQEALRLAGIPFEGDANKPRLIELAEGIQ